MGVKITKNLFTCDACGKSERSIGRPDGWRMVELKVSTHYGYSGNYRSDDFLVCDGHNLNISDKPNKGLFKTLFQRAFRL